MLAYSDPTPRWVPFTLAAVMTGGSWWGALGPVGASVATATKIAGVMGVLLLIAIVLQGRLYWTSQVDSLVIANDRAEMTMMCWLGTGKRFVFTANETSDWKATAKHDDPSRLSTVSFKLQSGESFDLSFLSPKVANLDLLAALAPQFFAKLRADFRSA